MCGIKTIWKIINGWNSIKAINSQTRDVESQQTPRTWNFKRITPKYIIFKLLKTSDKGTLKVPREEIHIIYREQKVRITDSLSDTIQVRGQCTASLKYRKKKISQPIILYLVKISFKHKGKTKTFSDIKYWVDHP